jgi:hypothetical protein
MIVENKLNKDEWDAFQAEAKGRTTAPKPKKPE